MKHCHFENHGKPFFEGWYLKHQNGERMIAFIPGVHSSGAGEARAFIQVITPEFSHVAEYPFACFAADRDRFSVRVGDSSFGLGGIHIHIEDADFQCAGRLDYRGITPLSYDIMGPFAIAPGMECRHGVLSLYHAVSGSLTIKGETVSLDGGIGYIEKDWGRSFPSRYTWLQCNDFPGRQDEEKRAVLLSIARIPYHGLQFEGLIAVIYDGGREYRIATYNGGKVVKNDGREIIIRRGKYLLKAEIGEAQGHLLAAPVQGEMRRLITEKAACKARFTFSIHGEQVFCDESGHASCEIVAPERDGRPTWPNFAKNA